MSSLNLKGLKLNTKISGFFLFFLDWEIKQSLTIDFLGKNRGLTLIIDAHSDILSPSTVRDDFEGFLALVNSQTKFPSLFEKV